MPSEKRKKFDGKMYRVSNLKEGPYKKSLVKNLMKARSEALALSVTSGSIDSMEKYRYIIGQIAALEAVLQELSNLLEDKEQNGKGTVIDLKTKQ